MVGQPSMRNFVKNNGTQIKESDLHLGTVVDSSFVGA